MPKKDMSPEERKAWGEKMKAAREAKKAETVTAPPAEPPETPEENVDQNDLRALLKRIEELESQKFFPKDTPTTPTSKTVVTKFSFNPKDYPDPRERLFTEPKLTLKGFNKDWWDLGWEVQKVNYEEDGVKLAAPRFLLEIYRIMEDEETGEPSAKRYVAKKGNFFEDPDSFLVIAEQHGHVIPESFTGEFMNEMRYLAMRDWLVDFFYPPNNTEKKSNKTETVIGNRLVEVFEISSEESSAIPFAQLKNKL
jgi:hypothetical protein